MTDISLSPQRAVAKTPSNSIIRHARYVIAENPVTGLAFGLFILIVLCALIGPYIVPHDPLASNTSATLAAPSLKHWFGTDQLGLRGPRAQETGRHKAPFPCKLTSS